MNPSGGLSMWILHVLLVDSVCLQSKIMYVSLTDESKSHIRMCVCFFYMWPMEAKVKDIFDLNMTDLLKLRVGNK